MNLKKLTISAMLVAVAVILSSFSIPIGASRCFPIQHMVNVIAAVFLGPVYGVSMAFCTALIRNLLGTGSLLAFPGSMVGAFISAMVFKYTKSRIGAYIGEVFGTGILGGMLCYPIASMMMGQRQHYLHLWDHFLQVHFVERLLQQLLLRHCIDPRQYV